MLQLDAFKCFGVILNRKEKAYSGAAALAADWAASAASPAEVLAESTASPAFPVSARKIHLES